MGSLNKKFKLEKKRRRLQRKLAKVVKNLTGFNNHSANEPEIFSHNINSDFVKVRNKCFKQLQDAVLLNLSSNYPENNINTEKIALELEQQALLTCLISPIYENQINVLINHLHNATKSKEVYRSELVNEAIVKHESANIEPINNSVLTKCTTPPVAKITPRLFVPTPQNVTLPVETAHFPLNVDICIDTEKVDKDTALSCDDEVEVEPGLTDFLCKMKSPYYENTTVDDKENENGKITSSLDYDVDNLMQILESDEDGEDNANDDIPSTSLHQRLKMMFDEANEPEDCKVVCDNPVVTVQNTKSARKQLKIAINNRYVFLFKVFHACKHMSSLRFYRTRRNFSTYFGEDSDNEQEEFFDDHNKFIDCCIKRISPTVVQFIKPYYKQGRINCNGSYVFKNLVTRIASSIVTVKDSPSNYHIRSVVDTFFPPGQKYESLNDVWCFEVNDD